MTVRAFVDKLVRERRLSKDLAKLFGRGPTADEITRLRISDTNQLRDF